VITIVSKEKKLHQASLMCFTQRTRLQRIENAWVIIVQRFARDEPSGCLKLCDVYG
jgi:hypothetical protein